MRGSTRHTPETGASRLGIAALAVVLAVLAACSGDSDESSGEAVVDEPSFAVEGVDHPLTGLPAETLDAVYRPAIAAKVDNGPGARPQAGINEADIVYEQLVEGGLTRLVAIYQSRRADSLGPIRSARSTDLAILRTLGSPLFAWSGANRAFAEEVRRLDLVDVGVEAQPQAYEGGGPFFTSSESLYVAAAGQGHGPPPHLAFEEPGTPRPDQAEEVSAVEVDFGATEVRFEWDADLGGWRRTQDGQAHVDAEGQAVVATNVIVRFVEHVDTGLRDSNNAPVLEGLLYSVGEAWMLTGGTVVRGQWLQGEGTEPASYFVSGQTVGMAPGTTWILLPPPGSAETFS